MNIVVASLVAYFLRAEVVHGRDKISKLKIEMQKIRRAAINFVARSMTTAEDRKNFMREDARFDVMKKEIEFIEEDVATLATLMVAIQHDDVEHLEAFMTKKSYH